MPNAHVLCDILLDILIHEYGLYISCHVRVVQYSEYDSTWRIEDKRFCHTKSSLISKHQKFCSMARSYATSRVG